MTKNLFYSFLAVLWRAPEILRMLNPPPRGTQKSDVYAFGIILFEIMGRMGPWGRPQPSLKCKVVYILFNVIFKSIVI